METVDRVRADPGAPAFRRFRSCLGEHLLVVPHSRIYDLDPAFAATLDGDPAATEELSATLGETVAGEAALDPVVLPRPQSLSLNVSSSCNLSCGYCYAGQGAFGGAQTAVMNAEVAFRAVERLLAGADPSRPVTIGFLGGEPMVNRALIHEVVGFASNRAVRRGLDVRFSITTNGTLLGTRDIALFRRHPFAVTVSLDGDQVTQDRQRPRANGRGSFSLLARTIAPLLAEPGAAKLAARMTVRAGDFDLEHRLEAIWALGFPEAGVAPLRVAADGSGFRDGDWPAYREALVAGAREELARALEGRPIRLTNFAIALKQIHAGASSPYSCGAGGGYFSVSATGDWYACHRAIGDPEFRLGREGTFDEAKREAFLAARHVHAKTDCRQCWARYLCSGGCHQEAATRSGPACDFIRDWLEFCLASYCELSAARPESFRQSLS